MQQRAEAVIFTFFENMHLILEDFLCHVENLRWMLQLGHAARYKTRNFHHFSGQAPSSGRQDDAPEEYDRQRVGFQLFPQEVGQLLQGPKHG
jgi:hypothetical protein